jgi:FixJ family two-component response regulator
LSDPLHQIYVVDDDRPIREALSRLLKSAGYKVLTFSSAKEFMGHYEPDIPGCLVLDISMPGITGLELQRWLMQSNSSLPIIFLTGRGDIPTSVRAMKEGAVDFLTKPVNEEDLLKAIEEGLRRERRARAAHAELEVIWGRLATLTPRELEVLKHVVSGQLNKQIADDLGTVEKTIKVHRGRVMEKMGVKSLAELVRAAERVGIGQAPASGGLSLPSQFLTL